MGIYSIPHEKPISPWLEENKDGHDDPVNEPWCELRWIRSFERLVGSEEGKEEWCNRPGWVNQKLEKSKKLFSRISENSFHVGSWVYSKRPTRGGLGKCQTSWVSGPSVMGYKRWISQQKIFFTEKRVFQKLSFKDKFNYKCQAEREGSLQFWCWISDWTDGGESIEMLKRRDDIWRPACGVSLAVLSYRFL